MSSKDDSLRNEDFYNFTKDENVNNLTKREFR